MNWNNMTLYDTIRETPGVSFVALTKKMGMSRYKLMKYLESPLLPCERNDIFEAIEEIAAEKEAAK